jgi:hypothetical protein
MCDVSYRETVGQDDMFVAEQDAFFAAIEAGTGASGCPVDFGIEAAVEAVGIVAAAREDAQRDVAGPLAVLAGKL